MENKKKNGSKYFIRLICGLFIVFLCLYAISLNGYVENKNEQKTLYTEEQIAQFEQDVQNGLEIDINNYILQERVNYENKMSNMGVKVSQLIDYIAHKTINLIVSLFGTLFS